MKKGEKMSAESRLKMSISAKNRPSNRLGKKHSIETRGKISKISRERSPKGENSPSYRDGKLKDRRGERFSKEYKNWRFDVFTRDKFTCQDCGDKKGGNLQAHHLKEFSSHPELRYEITNGITLCKTCHKKRHYGEYKN